MGCFGKKKTNRVRPLKRSYSKLKQKSDRTTNCISCSFLCCCYGLVLFA